MNDYGNLAQVTGAVHLLLGSGGMNDMGFSSPNGSSTGAEGARQSSGVEGAAGGAAGTGSGGGGTPGGAGGTGGGGKGLPFTGLEVGIVAAAGSALTAAGATLRRVVRRRGA